MKAVEFLFRRPVKVLQVFRNAVFYGKSQKSWEDRAHMMDWEVMQSQSGYLEEGILYLPETIRSFPDLPQSDLITLEDDNPPTAEVPNRGRYSLWRDTEGQTNRCFNLLHPRKFDFFEIAQEGDDLILSLRPGYFEVGDPERERFRVCVLRPGSDVEIRINGKTDFSLSSRRDRTYLEQHYVFRHLGLFSGCYLMKAPCHKIEKRIPEKRKVIDLKKPLW